MSVIMWLTFMVIRTGNISAAFQMKQLFDLIFSADIGNERVFSSALYLMDVLLIVMEYEYPHIAWISSLRETWTNCKHSSLKDTTSEEPMTRFLYGNFTFPTAKFKIFRHFPKWVVDIHMLENFLEESEERMEELLWKWVR